MAATPEQLAALEVLHQANNDYLQSLVEISAAIDTQKQNIADAEAAIASDQSQLDALAGDESDAAVAQREKLAANLAENASVVAANTNALDTNQSRLNETQDLINQNQAEQQSIQEAIAGPGATPEEVAGAAAAQDQGTTDQVSSTGPAAVPGDQTGYPNQVAYDDDGNLLPGWTLDENGNPVYVGGDFVEPATSASAADSREAATRANAQKQSTLQARVNQPSSADWRVRLQLAKSADYLYRAASPGILAPLADTDGVLFPYTPVIETSYKAKYDSSDLVHSNYKGYFYKSSAVEELTIRGTFTAQDTKEAQYLLAVIHFFRSVTKMFYGKDTQAGAPPPLVYLSGYGQYQFNRHPCVVTSFGYTLPQDIDYIRADGFNNYGLNLENRQNRSSGPAPSGLVDFVKSKLKINGLFPGGQPQVPSPTAVNQNVRNTNSTNSTYVPTKMEISITLLPIQTRNQVSKQFSVKGFANGDLLKGGFW